MKGKGKPCPLYSKGVWIASGDSFLLKWHADFGWAPKVPERSSGIFWIPKKMSWAPLVQEKWPTPGGSKRYFFYIMGSSLLFQVRTPTLLMHYVQCNWLNHDNYHLLHSLIWTGNQFTVVRSLIDKHWINPILFFVNFLSGVFDTYECQSNLERALQGVVRDVHFADASLIPHSVLHFVRSEQSYYVWANALLSCGTDHHTDANLLQGLPKQVGLHWPFLQQYTHLKI